MFFFFLGIFQQLHLHPPPNADRRRRWRGSWHCPRTMKCPRFGNTKTKALSWTRLEKLKHNGHSMLNGSYKPRLGTESRLYKCVLLWWRQWWWKGLWEQATWFKESLLMSARRKKVSKKNLKVTFTQAYPTRSFYAFLQPRNSTNLVSSSILFQWKIHAGGTFGGTNRPFAGAWGEDKALQKGKSLGSTVPSSVERFCRYCWVVWGIRSNYIPWPPQMVSRRCGGFCVIGVVVRFAKLSISNNQR